MDVKRHNSGFTMVEILAAVTILIIVGALIVVGVMQYIRSSYQREMDETAKEIYVAAQSHLAIAESLGALSGRTEKGDLDSGRENTRYYVVNSGDSRLNDSKSVLNAMLPPGSIDGTVRDGGSYVIQYKYTGSSAAVTGVFYADPNGRFKHEFSTGEYNNLFENYTDDAEARAHYPDGGDAIIGYYGGGDTRNDSGRKPITPILVVTNAARLDATITNASSFLGTGDTVVLYITGNESGAMYGPRTLISDSQNLNTFTIDDITTDGYHFADLNNNVRSNGLFADDKRFIPGEDITVQAFAYNEGSVEGSVEGSGVSSSAKCTTNSLFAAVTSAKSVNSPATSVSEALKNAGMLSTNTGSGSSGASSAQMVNGYAKITNIRHLENLSRGISGYNPASLESDEIDRKVHIEAYDQVVDLSWSGFCEMIAALKQEPAANTKVYALDGSSSAAHTFMPVDGSANTLTYNGNSRKISDVEVSNASDAGLFATLTGGSVSDLELVNFKVATTGGNAGTLAGTASGATLTNVFAHDTASSTSYGVTASNNAGGLVGSLTGGSVTGCAAAEYVSGSSGAAGGLVGTASNSSITQSYSGGHTTNGAYSSSSFNVSAGGDAGGLVGMSSNTPITSCYSTCSASGNTAGGLVGSLTNGSSIVNCYATGLTSGNSHGALLGNLDRSGINRASNGYYPAYLQAVDPTVFAVGNDDRIDDATVAESSTTAYEATIAGVPTTAAPYDSWLVSSMQSKYPYKTIKQLAGLGDSSLGGLSAHLTSHYGDWPVIERNVVNIR